MTTNPPFSERHQWWLVTVATLCGFVAAYNIGKISAALPEIRSEFEASLSFAATLVSSYSTVSMFSALLLGILVSRYGSFRIGGCGLLLLLIGGLFGSYAQSLPLLLATRVLEGMGYIAIAVAMPAFISSVCNVRVRPLAMGVWGAFVPGGIAISLLLSPALLQSGGWRTLWQAGCFFAAICLLLLIVFVRPAARQLQQSSASGVGAGVGADCSGSRLLSVFRRDPLVLAGCFAVYSANFSGLTLVLPTLWAESELAGAPFAARLAAVVVMMNILGNLTGGWLNSRGVPLRMVLSIALIGSGVFAGLVFLIEFSLLLQVICAGLSVFIGGMLPATVFASVALYSQRQKQAGLILGLVFQGAAVGQVFGPVFLGAVVDYFGQWQMAVVYFAGTSLIAVVLVQFLSEPSTDRSSIHAT
ncbi:hypothetical protein AB833_04640 [Chromatiales bacterium (ex Bugula neritina AB1)]|nr:hypothetical protein AB833_04640 [Chromatiales bacterium (ex Bugula neritina AB1)]